MIRIAICEDDPFYMKKEKQLIIKFFKNRDIEYKLTAFTSGIDFTKKFRGNFDIIFLDISMEDMDGIEAAKWIRENGSSAYIIFLTGYVEYALEGYKVNAHRYLLKNDEHLEETLEESLNSVLDRMQIYDKKITFNVVGGPISLSSSKIVYIDSKMHKTIIHVLDTSGELQEHYMYEKLDHVQEELIHLGFMRIHQSNLINKVYLKKVYRYKAELIYGIELGISKKYYNEVEDYYIRKRGEI